MIGLSFVVAAWRRYDYLQRCLESLRGQVQACDEIIVVEDGHSHDHIGTLARTYGARYIVLPEPRYRARMNAVMNTGWTAATGDVLVLTNQDITFCDCFTEAVRAHMAEVWDKRHIVIPRIQTQTLDRYDGIVPNLPEGITTNHWGADRPCIILRRCDCLPFDERFDAFRGSGTLEWAWRMVRSGCLVETWHGVTVTHHNHDDAPYENNLVPFGIMLYCALTGENYTANWGKAG